MINRTAWLGAGAVAVMVAGGVVVASSAIAAGGSHTITLRGTRLAHRELGRSHDIEADTLTRSGKPVGYATETCFFGGTGTACAVTVTLQGGVLYGHITFPITDGAASSVAKGKITGGLGSYSGAKGTIKDVTSASHGDYTIKYSG